MRWGWGVLALGWLGCVTGGRPPTPTAPVVDHPDPLPAARELSPIVEYPEGESRHLANVRQLTLDGEANAEARFSPGSRMLVFRSTRGNPPLTRLYLLDLDGGDLRALTEQASWSATFLPDGKRVVMATPGPTRTHIQERTLSGPTQLLADDGGPAADPAVSPDGKKLIYHAAEGTWRLMDLQTHSVRTLPVSTASEGMAFFPDGQRVVFVSPRDDGRADLFQLAIPDGTQPEPLTHLAVPMLSPVVHPVTQAVLFAADLTGDYELYLRHPGGDVERVTYREGFDTLPAFSPDGKRLAWTSGRQGGHAHIFVADWRDP